MRGDGCEGAHRIHVALHDVTVEAATGGQAALQVDGVAGVQVAEVGAAQSLTHRVGAELAGLQLVEVDSSEAYTVDGEGATVFEVGDDVTGVEGQVGCVATFDGGDGFYGAEGANDSGKHVCFSFSRRVRRGVVVEGDGRRWFVRRYNYTYFSNIPRDGELLCQHTNQPA